MLCDAGFAPYPFICIHEHDICRSEHDKYTHEHSLYVVDGGNYTPYGDIFRREVGIYTR